MLLVFLFMCSTIFFIMRRKKISVDVSTQTIETPLVGGSMVSEVSMLPPVVATPVGVKAVATQTTVMDTPAPAMFTPVPVMATPVMATPNTLYPTLALQVPLSPARLH